MLMGKKYIKKIIYISLILFIALLLFIGAVNFYINQFSDNICKKDSKIRPVALVLGARVWNNGDLSPIFKDRVKTAIKLYKDKKVKKILVSGDHGQKNYDEVNAAKDFLLENGVEPEDIFLDHAGFDTYDSLYRAREIFKVNSLIIVTQNFHLPRALYLADNLGLEACGTSADLQKYVGEKARERREQLAKIKAWLNIVLNSKPKYLGNSIDISGDGQETWD
jgi:SanA protein